MQPIIMDIVFHCKAPRATGQALNKCTIIIMILSLLSFEFCLFFTEILPQMAWFYTGVIFLIFDTKGNFHHQEYFSFFDFRSAFWNPFQ